MKNKILLIIIIVLSIILTVVNVSCTKSNESSVLPELPANLQSNTNSDNVKSNPIIKMYDIQSKTIKEMDIEEYIMGVVGGEMFNSWNKEALKAQAILARTFTMYFLTNQKSKYSGADISNDITEAQAYNSSQINDKIRQAVNETKGKVICQNGEYIQAWFHSNSGGKTALASEGLNYKSAEPEYIKIVESPETVENSENYKWNITLSKADILTALRTMGVSVSSVSEFKIGQKGESGRALTLVIAGKEVSASTFRLAVGSTKMKSTLINKISLLNNEIYIEGKGYGHGVGMSQWGAKIMADNGKSADEIINYYFNNVTINSVY